MIEEYTVKWICQGHIREILHDYPGTVKEILAHPDFRRFIELCTFRCRDMARSNIIQNQYMFVDFVKKAVTQYAFNKVNERFRLYKKEVLKPYEVITPRDAGILSEVPPQD
jgi:hypothetical protein